MWVLVEIQSGGRVQVKRKEPEQGGEVPAQLGMPHWRTGCAELSKGMGSD